MRKVAKARWRKRHRAISVASAQLSAPQSSQHSFPVSLNRNILRQCRMS